MRTEAPNVDHQLAKAKGEYRGKFGRNSPPAIATGPKALRSFIRGGAPHPEGPIPNAFYGEFSFAVSACWSKSRPHLRSGIRRGGPLKWRMPTLSEFFGILIRMYWDDHPPPHFHAIYGEHEAQYSIATLDVIHGSLPRRAHAMVVEWASLHRDELMKNWERCQVPAPTVPIQPLE